MTRAHYKALVNGFGGLALAVSLAVLAFPRIAAAQEPTPPSNPQLGAPAPIEGKQVHVEPVPGAVAADFHVRSTALGFEQGIGPAVGREVSYEGKQFTVADVFAADGQPCFSGGSPFTIAPAGGRLVIGLRTAPSGQVNVAALR